MGRAALGIPSIVSSWGTESWRKKRPRPPDSETTAFIEEPQTLMERCREMEEAKVKAFLSQPKRYKPGSRTVPRLRGVLSLSEGETLTDIRTMVDAPVVPFRLLEGGGDGPSSKRRTSSPPSPGSSLLSYRRGGGRRRDEGSNASASGPPTPVEELLPEESEDEEDIDVLDRLLVEPPMHFRVVGWIHLPVGLSHLGSIIGVGHPFTSLRLT